MANHYIAINRGVNGSKISDFTLGSSSASSADIELRIADVDGGGKVLNRKDVVIALEAFTRALLSGAIYTGFPPM